MKIKSEKIENGFKTIIFENGFVVKESIIDENIIKDNGLEKTTIEEKILANVEYSNCLLEIEGGI